MAVTYSDLAKTARMQAVVSAIGSTGVLEILGSDYTTVLATVPLANPAGAVSAGVLTFTMPRSDSSIDASGTATAARIRDASGGNDIITGLTVTDAVGGSGDIIVSTTSFVAGQVFTLSTGSITHG